MPGGSAEQLVLQMRGVLSFANASEPDCRRHNSKAGKRQPGDNPYYLHGHSSFLERAVFTLKNVARIFTTVEGDACIEKRPR
jgi:hypothetical protein